MDKKGKAIVTFGGGWATDFGPGFIGAPQANTLQVPFLLTADNLTYELDGGVHKVGGASKLNSVAVSSGSNAFHGLTDVFFQGTGGNETHKRFAYVGTSLQKEDIDGTWDSLTTGLEDNKEPCFEIFNDLVFWASSSTVDVPQEWDGAAGSTSAVGGTPPNFAFMVKHKNRMFASGVAGHPSRLYYSAALDPDDWVGVGSGSIDIDPDDGDRITGIVSHKNELIIFKGPHRFSIHRMTGSSPSGSDAFAIVPFVTGVGSVNHNGIFRVNDDLVFPSSRGIHSLAATASYGDYVEAFLSRPISTYYRDELNASTLNTCQGVNYQARGCAVWTFAKAGGTAKNVMLVYDYRFQPGRWIRWHNYVDAKSIAILQTSAGKPRLHAGTTGGFVYELDTTARSIDSSTSYTFRVETPFCNLGTSAIMKSAEDFFVSIFPKGDYDLTFGYVRDRNAEQTQLINQVAGDTLA